MTPKEQKQAPARLPQLLASLPPLETLLRGSLLERHTFHPSTVSCASGQGHLQWVLNVNYPGAKNRQLTLHPKQVPHVRRQLQNLERVRQVLEQICELNQQALRAGRDQLRSAGHA
jgi:hypothetical protein